MLKKQLKGCLMVIFMFIVALFFSACSQVCVYFFPEYKAIVGIAMICVVAAVFAGIISYNIYNFVMKRYKVLAPEEPYEYTKMADITYTKNENRFVRKMVRISN